MNYPLTIRLANHHDFSAIEAFDVFAGDRLGEITRGECVVAIEDGIVVGYATLDRTFYGRWFLRFLCVRPASRQRGIATALLDWVEQKAAGEQLFTSTESDNVAMLHIFNRRGYRVSGVIDNLQDASEVVFLKSPQPQGEA